MSDNKAPMRVWLDVELSPEGKDFGVSAWSFKPKEADDVSLWISAAALRELVERWLTESTDPDWPKQAREAWVDCANELEKLLEDE